MWWLVIVLAGHLANAGAFVIDKILLTKSIRHPSVYVFYIGALGLLAFLLLPFGSVSLLPAYLTFQALVSGATFMLALLGFFTALKRGETTRVVPFVGALIPIWTMIFASLLLGEQLALLEWWGVMLLVAGAILISYESSHDRSFGLEPIALIVVTAALFAMSSTALKVVFNGTDFINGFLWTRAFAFLTVLPLLLLPTTRRAVIGGAGGGKERPSKLLFIGQAMGALGFLFIAWGISLAPQVTIVNAMQGVQYAFLFILVLVFSRIAPRLIPEKLSSAIITQKIVAIIVLCLGLILVA